MGAFNPAFTDLLAVVVKANLAARWAPTILLETASIDNWEK